MRAKFLATMAFYLAMLAPTFVYYVVLRNVGLDSGPHDQSGPVVSVDIGPVLTGVLGMLLMGAFFASLGLLTSALTSSQILAALLSWVLIILFLLVGTFPRPLGLTGTPLGDVLEFL